ncbi:hypothetical protein JCM10207_004654 [Rhodosporidiobolus poonsookiae]
MPPSYTASTSSATPLPHSPVLCPPSPTPSMLAPPTSNLQGSPRRGPPSPICPPPYSSSSLSPLSPQSPCSPVSLEELEADPHYLATPTQRSYFVQLSDLFEAGAPAQKDDLGGTPSGRFGAASEEQMQKLRRRSVQISVLAKGQRVDDEPSSSTWCCACTIS